MHIFVVYFDALLILQEQVRTIKDYSDPYMSNYDDQVYNEGNVEVRGSLIEVLSSFLMAAYANLDG